MPSDSTPAPLRADLETTVERVVEWSDTDASGHQHNTAIVRWIEAAEADLLRRKGLSWLFGRTPRVRHELSYRGRLWFGDPIEIRIWVARLGRTSLTFGFEITGPRGVAADGLMVVAHAEPDAPTATPWPDDVRALLGTPLECVVNGACGVNHQIQGDRERPLGACEERS